MYGIKGNESTPDQNINHFINAIRAFNKPEAFTVKTGRLGNIANSVIPGRDASNTELKPVDLWIPSFGVAAKMDVGSGTVTGEVSRNLKKIDQKIEDFKLACQLSGQFIPGAIARHAANSAKGLVEGLIKFAKEAAIILASSTAVGAIIGAFAGGVGAAPGATIGFEVGLQILTYYGLYKLVEAIFGIAGNLLSQLSQFIKLVWTANGDRQKLEEAAKSLAEALGSLVDAILLALVAYLAKKGADAFSKTKFAQTVGEKPLMQWLKERQQFKTSNRTSAQNLVNKIINNPKSIWGKSADDIARLFNDAGYKAIIEQSKRGSMLSQQIRIEGHPKIANIQVHPGGGWHGGAYYKISTSTQGKIKVVDRATYKPTPGEKVTIIYYNE